MNMDDVRLALWEAYEKVTKEPDYYGKSSEAACELIYPNYFQCENIGEFLTPTCLMIYSYALGPSRRHYFYFSNKDKQIDYNNWECVNPYKTAVRVIKEWVTEFLEDSKQNSTA